MVTSFPKQGPVRDPGGDFKSEISNMITFII